MRPDASYVVPEELAGQALDAVLRALGGGSWSQARGRIESGKVQVDGETIVVPTRHVRAGQRVELFLAAPRTRDGAKLPEGALVYFDAHVVVVRKPSGMSTVPFDEGERGTLDRLVAEEVHRRSKRGGPTPSLGVVQRLDKETSGLIVFARSMAAKKLLGNQLRFHNMHRRYVAIAHGVVPARRFETRLIADRGDGIRGSTQLPGVGQVSITHVEPLEALRGATLVGCRLETGRTHQIRIHLSESGHPIVGEKVYVRGFPGPYIAAPRVMLHAAELGFVHPGTEREVRYEDPLPEDMVAMLEKLRR